MIAVKIHPATGPDFQWEFRTLADARTVIMGRNAADQVEVRIEESRASLHASNTLLDVVRHVAACPGWRFDLTVLPDEATA